MASTISLFEGGLMLIGNSDGGVDELAVSSFPIKEVEVLSISSRYSFLEVQVYSKFHRSNSIT
jgi:hypothetical protein